MIKFLKGLFKTVTEPAPVSYHCQCWLDWMAQDDVSFCKVSSDFFDRQRLLTRLTPKQKEKYLKEELFVDKRQDGLLCAIKVCELFIYKYGRRGLSLWDQEAYVKKWLSNTTILLPVDFLEMFEPHERYILEKEATNKYRAEFMAARQIGKEMNGKKYGQLLS